MPFFLALPCPVFQIGEAAQAVWRGEQLTFRATSWRYKKETGVVDFDGNVIAEFGVTSVRASHVSLQLDPKSNSGQLLSMSASGEVKLIDPDGTVQARSLSLDFVEAKGFAVDAGVSLAGMQVAAERIDLEPGIWTLYHVNAKLCEDNHFGLAAKKIVYRPNVDARFETGQFRMFGATVFGLRSATLGLGPEPAYTLFPRLILGSSKGVGVQWSGKYSFTPAMSILSKFAVASESKPWGSAYIKASLLSAKLSPLDPRSDTAEVAEHGYLENIVITSPSQELLSERRNRGSLSFGTSWNQSRYGDVSGEINKPFEIILDYGGSIENWGWSSQIRAHKLDQASGDDINRMITLATISAPELRITPNVSLLSRVDSRTFSNNDGTSGGWIRGQLGLSFSASKRVRFGVGYSSASTFGDPMLSFEALDALQSWHLRADVDFGATKIGALFKYDLDSNRWSDHEYMVQQAAGCIQPFVIYRERPKSVRIGFTFRPLEKLEKLQGSISSREIGNQLPKKT